MNNSKIQTTVSIQSWEWNQPWTKQVDTVKWSQVCLSVASQLPTTVVPHDGNRLGEHCIELHNWMPPVLTPIVHFLEFVCGIVHSFDNTRLLAVEHSFATTLLVGAVVRCVPTLTCNVTMETLFITDSDGSRGGIKLSVPLGLLHARPVHRAYIRSVIRFFSARAVNRSSEPAVNAQWTGGFLNATVSVESQVSRRCLHPCNEFVKWSYELYSPAVRVINVIRFRK